MTIFSPVLAALTNPLVTNGPANQTGIEFFGAFIPRMISLIFIIGCLAFFFMLIIGGIRWVMSGGDKGAVEGARAQITHALTGLFILVSVWAIAKVIQSVFGINVLNIDLGPLLPGGAGTATYP